LRKARSGNRCRIGRENGGLLGYHQQKALPGGVQTIQGRELLSRILAMLSRF
jgi:hypothetical protein